MRHVFYPVVVDREGDEFVVRLPDFGRYSRISVKADPFIEAQEQLDRIMDRRRRARAKTLPPASPLTDFLDRDPKPWGLFQVPVAIYREWVRVGLNMEPTLLRRVDEAAIAQGMSRTAFLAAAATDALQRVA